MTPRHFERRQSERAGNMRRIVELVRRRTVTTYADMRAVTGLSDIGSFVRELQDIGVLEGLKQRQNRIDHSRSKGVRLHPDAGRLIGIDVQHGSLRAAVFDFAFNELCSAEKLRTSPTGHDAKGVLDDTVAAVELLVRKLGRAELDKGPLGLLGIGVGLPGPVHRRDQHVARETHILPGWRGIDLRAELARRLPDLLPEPDMAIFDNDASLGALGVQTRSVLDAESLRDIPRDIIYVRLGDGVGAGLIVKGKPVGGADGYAGEIGHFQVDPHGPLCPRCGNRGCVETFVSAARVVDDLRRSGLTDVEDIGQVVSDDAPPACRRALWYAGWHLGLALAHAGNLLNPRCIFLGGPIALSDDFLDAVVQATKHAGLIGLDLPVRAVDQAAYPRKSPELLGAAAIVIQRRVDDALFEHITTHLAEKTESPA